MLYVSTPRAHTRSCFIDFLRARNTFYRSKFFIQGFLSVLSRTWEKIYPRQAKRLKTMLINRKEIILWSSLFLILFHLLVWIFFKCKAHILYTLVCMNASDCMCIQPFFTNNIHLATPYILWDVSLWSNNTETGSNRIKTAQELFSYQSKDLLHGLLK